MGIAHLDDKKKDDHARRLMAATNVKDNAAKRRGMGR